MIVQEYVMQLKTNNMDKPNSSEHHVRYEAFSSTIDELKKSAKAEGIIITDDNIMEKLNITKSFFQQYYETDRAPGEVFITLREHFGKFMNTIIMTHIYSIQIDEHEDDKEDDYSDLDSSEGEIH